MINCSEPETQEHLLMNCCRAQEVWSIFKGLGVNFKVCYKSVMYGLLDEKMLLKHNELFQMIISVVCVKIWKTRCAVTLHQTAIDSTMVVRQVLTDLPWHILDL
ncbi:hypothetical protein ABVT39_013642 [Epinephelus coioides]